VTTIPLSAQWESKEFIYRLPGVIPGSQPGAHRSLGKGTGMNFAGHVRLFDQPDPRRLDLRASLLDIRGDWLVKTHLQRASMSVSAIVDVCASMRFGNPSKLSSAAGFLKSLGRSASAYGDSVSMHAFDATVREDLYMPAQKHRAMGNSMAALIGAAESQSAVAGATSALLDCCEYSAGNTSLVFLVSDFHGSLEELDKTFALMSNTLASARIVPVIIWSDSEVKPPAKGHLLRLQTMDTSPARHIWLNSRVRNRWLRKVSERRSQLAELFGRHDIAPFFVTGSFNASALSRYFMEQMA